MTDWRSILLIPIGVLGSALLCLWLAQNMGERFARDQQRLTLLEQRDRLAAGLAGQIEQQRDIVQWLAKRTSTAGNVATIVTVEQLRNQLKEQPVSTAPAGLSVIRVADKQVISTDDVNLKSGDVLAAGHQRSALSNSENAKPISNIVGDSADIWFSYALASDPQHRLLARAELKLSATDAMRVSFNAQTSNPSNAEPDRMLKLSGPDSGQYAIDGVIDQVSPSLPFRYRTDVQVGQTNQWGLVSRLLAGSGLLALLLGALAWRWQHHRQGERKQRRRSQFSDSSVALAASVNAVSLSGDFDQTIEAQDDVLEPVAQAVNALNARTVSVMQVTEQSARDVALGVSQLRKSASELTDLSAKHQDVLNVALDRLTQSVNALDQISLASEQAKPSVQDLSLQSSASAQSANATVDSLAAAREQVRQSEKRVKGLGERVQEISQTVKKVADLSDRTGILALNASLQAAAAGPAGREFAALADEVKRLSDSGGAATEQIGQLVNAIHSESAQALTAINAAIEQTVNASHKAGESQQSIGTTHNQLDNVLQRIGELTQVIDKQAGASDALAKQVDRVDQYNDQLRELIASQSANIGSVSKQAEQLIVSASLSNGSRS